MFDSYVGDVGLIKETSKISVVIHELHEHNCKYHTIIADRKIILSCASQQEEEQKNCIC